MFSFLTGPTIATSEHTTEAPTMRMERNPDGGAVCPEDARYADLVLLPNRKNEDEFLIKVGASNNKKGNKGKGTNHAFTTTESINATTPAAVGDSGTFEVVTASAFDMVEVNGGKVPRYINAKGRTKGGLGSRCASGEEWVVVSPHKNKQQTH